MSSQAPQVEHRMKCLASLAGRPPPGRSVQPRRCTGGGFPSNVVLLSAGPPNRSTAPTLSGGAAFPPGCSSLNLPERHLSIASRPGAWQRRLNPLQALAVILLGMVLIGVLAPVAALLPTAAPAPAGSLLVGLFVIWCARRSRVR